MDQLISRKAYQHYVANAILIAIAAAQFVITGLLPLSADTFAIVGE